MKQPKTIYSLIPFKDYKAILGTDDRDDKYTKFALITASHTIEQYCKRRLIIKRHFEDLNYWGDRVIPLSHYPVKKVLAVYMKEHGIKEMQMIEPEFYHIIPETESNADIPASIALSPGQYLEKGERTLKAIYTAGFETGKIPSDLALACYELATFNLNKLKTTTASRIMVQCKQEELVTGTSAYSWTNWVYRKILKMRLRV